MAANLIAPTRLRLRGVLLVSLAATRAAAVEPVLVQRFALPGPVAGVVARVDLRDPRVEVDLAMAEGPAAGPAAADCAGRLEVPSAVARRRGFAVAVNASYFRAEAKEVQGRKVPFYVGNCATPVGWHFSSGQLRTRPTVARMQATLVVHAGGRLTLHAALDRLPEDACCAVSGDAMVLEAGQAVAAKPGAPRHPRTSVGLSRDGATLLLVVVDGRQEGHSRGATLAELGELMKGLGAHSAINLDGGGSTAMVVRDPVSGVHAVANRPSERSPELPEVCLERPVVDVLGVLVKERAPGK